MRAEARRAARPVERREERRARETERVRRTVSGRGDRDASLRYRVVERAQVVSGHGRKVGVDDEHRPGPDLPKRSLDRGSLSAARDRESRSRPSTGSGDTTHVSTNARPLRQAPSSSIAGESSSRASLRGASSRASPRTGSTMRITCRSGRTAIVTRLTAHSRPVVVLQLDVPDPGRPPAVDAARRCMDRPLADRAQERRVVRHPEADVPVGHDADVRPERRERLGDRRMDAAVHEPDRLQQVLAHRNVRAHDLVGRLVDLEPVVAGRTGTTGIPTSRRKV